MKGALERTSPSRAGRSRAVDPAAIRAALDAGEPVRLILLDEDSQDPQVLELARLAAARQIPLWRGSPGDLQRMSPDSPPARALALLGPDPRADLAGLLAEGGAVWLLHRAAYPSNVGFTIRTAEVSGAAGVVVDAMFNHAERSRVSHVSMGAQRLLPVLWESTSRVLAAARAADHRIIAVEDTGTLAPWQVDLRGPVVLIVGNERSGIEAEVLKECDAVIRIPMQGFVPSYNLQAAVSAVATERLRQLQT